LICLKCSQHARNTRQAEPSAGVLPASARSPPTRQGPGRSRRPGTSLPIHTCTARNVFVPPQPRVRRRIAQKVDRGCEDKSSARLKSHSFGYPLLACSMPHAILQAGWLRLAKSKTWLPHPTSHMMPNSALKPTPGSMAESRPTALEPSGLRLSPSLRPLK
jgi:hypothetical protein